MYICLSIKTYVALVSWQESQVFHTAIIQDNIIFFFFLNLKKKRIIYKNTNQFDDERKIYLETNKQKSKAKI